ncbi:hypothetical protein SCLCIDRAFT_24875 [Scleroderma citrinum Foug A]|uniref:DUF6532 domain-containing protein n=1 Tax=Scleroderma citrinum Foug A TaxID=1036808 RepID=A0A0C3E3G0_9AGAM|nr:hypothetical protein SCLCIDRAFT_24875 [Scleroderma citrinum Foug A]
MAANDVWKWLTQSEDVFPEAAGPETHKKPWRTNKTDQTDDQTVHCSSRANKGSGGQITQLQNIECMQVEWMAPKASHASQLEISTMNEPLNPMAPTKPKPRVKTSSACVQEDVNSPGLNLPEPATLDKPPPSYQLATEGSWYSFRFDSGQENTNIYSSAVPTSYGGSAVMSGGGMVHPASRGGPILAMSHEGCTASNFRGGSTTPSSHVGSATPSTRGGSTAPGSRVGSVAPSIRGGSSAPGSCVGSVAPSTHGGSSTPGSRVGSVAPGSHVGSAAPSAHGGPTALSSCMASPSSWSGSIPHSRTTSINIKSTSTRFPAFRRAAESVQTGYYRAYSQVVDNNVRFKSTQCRQPSPIDPGIDEVSPDEDDRVAAGMIQDYWHAEPQSQHPDNGQTVCSPPINPALLVEDVGPQTNIIEEHHHQNCFPHAPDPKRLCNIREGQPTSVQDVALDNLLSTDIEHPNLDVTEQVSSPPGELNGSVTKLHSYPYKFHEIIKRAKQLAQCGTALDPYPNRVWFVDEKGPVYVTEAITEHMEKGVFVLSGPSALCSLFPEVFTQEVPKPTVCLATTAIRAAIDEYTITGIRQDRNFKYTTYSKVFTQLMGLARQLSKVLHFLLASSDLLHSATVDNGNAKDVEEDDFNVVLD